MTIEERIVGALSGTGIPVSQPPGEGSGERYITFVQTSGRMTGYSANAARSVRYLYTIDLYSRESQDSAQVMAILRTLQAADIRPISWGPTYYETDTRWYHLPITVEINDNLEG